MPATVTCIDGRLVVVAVMIGIDPHKGSHTAVAISPAEELLGELRVRASAAQAQRLLEWAGDWPQRTWAIGGAAGLGHLLAQQLLAAGDRVAIIGRGAQIRLFCAPRPTGSADERKSVVRGIWTAASDVLLSN
jgi:hypothetical protein